MDEEKNNKSTTPEKDPVVERMRSEGDLLRNTGTNSIKSINVRLDKFTGVFDAIHKNIEQQTFVLNGIFDLQQSELLAARNKEQLERVDSSYGDDDEVSGRRPSSRRPASIIPDRNTSDNIESGLFGFIGGLFSNLNWRAVLGVGVLGSALRAGAIGMTILRGGVLLTLAPIIGEFVGEFVAEGLKQINVGDVLADSIGGRAATSAFAASIGLIFGRRWALIGGAVGFASTFAEQFLDALGFTEAEMSNTHNIMGAEISNRNIATGVLGTIAFSASRILMNSSFWDGLFNSASRSRTWLAQRAVLSASIAGAVMSAYIMYGDDVKNWLENKGMSEGAASTTVDVASFVAMGVSMGAMFGPTGMLVGAAIGLAVGLGKSIYDWLIRANRDSRERVERELERLDNLRNNTLDRMERGEEIEGIDLGMAGDEEIQRRIEEGSVNEDDLAIAELTDELRHWADEINTINMTGGLTGPAERQFGEALDRLASIFGTDNLIARLSNIEGTEPIINVINSGTVPLSTIGHHLGEIVVESPSEQRPPPIEATEPRETPGHNPDLLEQMRRGLQENADKPMIDSQKSSMSTLEKAAINTITQTIVIAPNVQNTNVGGRTAIHNSNSTTVTSVGGGGASGLGAFGN